MTETGTMPRNLPRPVLNDVDTHPDAKNNNKVATNGRIFFKMLQKQFELAYLFGSVEALDEMLAMRPSSDSSSTEANVVSKDQNYAYRLLKMYNLCERTSFNKDL